MNRKALELSNAKRARREAARKAIVARNRAKKVPSPAASSKGGKGSSAILRTCACGRVIRGSSYFIHTKACAHAKSGAGEKP
jgi:hypothetical protein